MAYSAKVLDHYENPRNVGSLDKNDETVGTGMVGAPACGDVMKLQIKVLDGIITDAKFKTYGCFVGNTTVNTPTHGVKMSDLKVGDEVLSWNGVDIIPNKIKEIITRFVNVDELLVVEFQRESYRKNMKPRTFKLICTREHVFWNANNKPILAEDLVPGQELYEITEYELRKLTNVRHRSDFRKKISERMYVHNANFDHSTLPQNQPGYVVTNSERLKKNSAASKRNWQNSEYIKNWKQGMAAVDRSAITSVEQAFINLFEEHSIAVKYSAGKIWIQTNEGPASPDFIVPGKKKCIEVYTKRMPKFMEDRSDESDYVERRTAQLKTAGYETLCIAIEDIDSAIEQTQNFVHNGMKIISIRPIGNKNELRGTERNERGQVKVYDLKLEDGAHVYFTNRVGSHNCGSAIASSSLITEMVKGMTLDQAVEIKNIEIAKELALPPVKIHCSILAEDAIKAAIADYRKKHDIAISS
jgi:NifU-like protein involved in Fe-S cluster formation